MDASSDVFQHLYEDLEELLQTYEAAEPAGPQPQRDTLPEPRVPGSAEEAPEGQDSLLDELLEALQSPVHLSSQGYVSTTEPSQNQAPVPEGALLGIPLTSQSPAAPEVPVGNEDVALECLLGEGMEGPPCHQSPAGSPPGKSDSTATLCLPQDTAVLKSIPGPQALPGQQPVMSESAPTQLMTFPAQQPFSGTPAPFPMLQVFSGHQHAVQTAPIMWLNQGPSSGSQTLSGKLTLFTGDQTPQVGQGSLLVGLPGAQVVAGQTVLGTQPLPPSSTPALCGILMAPAQGSAWPAPGLLVSSIPAAQGHIAATQGPQKTRQRRYQLTADGHRCYACPFQGCAKVYRKASHLQIHERIHTGEKPYVCDVEGCTWSFPRSDELRRHKRKHTGERPYLCPRCHKDFARADHLKQHARCHR